MKDKEIIEEMAKEIFNTCAWRFGKPNDYKEIFNDIAEDLIKLNYQKVNEDSVVLSREELEEKYEPSEKFMSVARELEDLKQNLEDKVVISKGEYEELLKVNKADLAEQANYTRKETAEKIYRELQGHGTTYVKKWIVKQFGVEIKE